MLWSRVRVFSAFGCHDSRRVAHLVGIGRSMVASEQIAECTTDSDQILNLMSKH
jgi:hypothetical protein